MLISKAENTLTLENGLSLTVALFRRRCVVTFPPCWSWSGFFIQVHTSVLRD